jgi:hypothetical protein
MKASSIGVGFFFGKICWHLLAGQFPADMMQVLSTCLYLVTKRSSLATVTLCTIQPLKVSETHTAVDFMPKFLIPLFATEFCAFDQDRFICMTRFAVHVP